MLASLGMPRRPFSGEGAGPEKGPLCDTINPKSLLVQNRWPADWTHHAGRAR